MINPTPGLSGRQILLLTLSAAVLVLPLVLVALWVYGKHQWADGQLASLEPRYARVLGMQQQQTEIQEALEQLQGIRAQHVYPRDIHAGPLCPAVDPGGSGATAGHKGPACISRG